MNPLLIGRLALVASVFFAGWWVNGWRWESKYQKLDAQYQSFSQGVARLGEQAKAKNALQALNDLKAKERADEQNRMDHARDAAIIARMRYDTDSARGSIVPPAPAGSKCPEGQACFDAAELERAERTRREAVRGLVDEGTAIATDLNTAKKWAAEVRLKLSTTLKGVSPCQQS